MRLNDTNDVERRGRFDLKVAYYNTVLIFAKSPQQMFTPLVKYFKCFTIVKYMLDSMILNLIIRIMFGFLCTEIFPVYISFIPRWFSTSKMMIGLLFTKKSEADLKQN